MSRATDSAESFHLSIELAEAYEAQFVPALFRAWATDLLAAGAGGRSAQRTALAG